jgi:arginase
VDTPHCLGVEITVFDPDYDPDGAYAEEIASALVAGLTPVRHVDARPDLVAAREDLASPGHQNLLRHPTGPGRLRRSAAAVTPEPEPLLSGMSALDAGGAPVFGGVSVVGGAEVEPESAGGAALGSGFDVEAESAAHVAVAERLGAVASGGDVGSVGGADPVGDAALAADAGFAGDGGAVGGVDPVGHADRLGHGDRLGHAEPGAADVAFADEADFVDAADVIADAEPLVDAADVELTPTLARSLDAEPEEGHQAAGNEAVGDEADGQPEAGHWDESGHFDYSARGHEDGDNGPDRGLRPLGSAPLLDSEPLPATRPGMLRPRQVDGFSLPAQRPAFDVGPEEPADII